MDYHKDINQMEQLRADVQKLKDLLTDKQVKEYFDQAEIQQVTATTSGVVVEFSEPVKAFYIRGSAAFIFKPEARTATSTFPHGGYDVSATTWELFRFPVKVMTVIVTASTAQITVVGLR